MKMIDEIEAKRTARALLLVAAGIAIVSTTSFWRSLTSALSFWFPARSFKDRPFISSEAEIFFALCAAILLVCATCSWLFRRRLLLTDEGVRHYPFLAYHTNDFFWKDVLSWGSRVTLLQDDGGHKYPSTIFYVELRNGRIIEEPGFSEVDLAAELENRVGERLDIRSEQ
jgi:hypothetical protein